jgi:lipopolysaccharide/colanic/teichoic acid biosynthesis glycosyltransferase
MRDTSTSEQWRLDGLVESTDAPGAAAPLRRYPTPRPLGRGRRAFDLIGGVFALIVLAPVFLFVALAVRLTSPGPIFYRQTRVGINRRCGVDRRNVVGRYPTNDRRRKDRRTLASAGCLFRIIKFRSMVDNAEASLGPAWAAENDARITPIGKLLRRTRLDEIPQIFNVLRGDMSFIGPRPERPFFVEKFRRAIPDYMERLTVPPGITGLAQVEHCYDTSEDDVKQKLEYDIRYLRNLGWWTDLRILAKTVLVVVSGSGAR